MCSSMLLTTNIWPMCSSMLLLPPQCCYAAAALRRAPAGGPAAPLCLPAGWLLPLLCPSLAHLVARTPVVSPHPADPFYAELQV